MEVYYYIPAEEVENVIECGMSLTKWYDKEVIISGEARKCISALLNPKDDMGKYSSVHSRCVKLEIPLEHCFAADRLLYDVGRGSQDVMALYTGTVIPLERYIFGTYRLPECLVSTTVLPGHISVLDKRLDSPVLFENSETLYVNNIIEDFRERYINFNDIILYSLFSNLTECEKMYAMKDDEKKLTVFFDKASGKAYIIRTPDTLP